MPTSPFSSRTPCGADLCKLPQPLWIHMRINPVDLEGLVSLVSSIDFGSYILSASSSTGFHEPRGEGFDGDILFSAKWSLTVFVLSDCASLFTSISCRSKPLWWWLSKVLIHEYSRTALGDFLLLCSFSRTVNRICFCTRSLVSGFWSPK